MDPIVREYLFGDLTIQYLKAFYIFSIIGFMLMRMLHFLHGKKIKKKSISGLLFIRQAFAKLISNIIIVFVIIRFADYFIPGYEINMFLGLLIGSGIDVISIAVMAFLTFSGKGIAKVITKISAGKKATDSDDK